MNDIGHINGHIIGRILKDTVRRATIAIRSERTVFEAHTKQGYSGNMDDVFTSADTKAQEIYLRTFRECFPRCGVIGEEDSLIIPSQTDCNAYFTVDPLDGTKAFVRRQSHGVGTMVASFTNRKSSLLMSETSTRKKYTGIGPIQIMYIALPG